MTKLVILKIVNGNFEQGFSVIVQIGQEGKQQEVSVDGNLPPAPQLPELYQLWQSEYLKYIDVNLPRLGPPTNQTSSRTQKSSSSDFIKAVNEQADKLIKYLNNWLNSEIFRLTKETLLRNFQDDEQTRVIIETTEPTLRRLPWYLWDLFTQYTQAEVAISLPNYQGRHQGKSYQEKVRILAILGDCIDPITKQRINIEVDQSFVKNLPDVDPLFLIEPEKREINEQLWQQGYDILFFAGHSRSNEAGTTGKIYINDRESLNIKELKYAVSQAIKNGLQLAILNSCDGLGIAFELGEFDLPQTIVMREPVPDFVAQQFLKYFLDAYANKGKSLYLAFREARERLHGLEEYYPCASWLPVICQNPAEIPPTWQSLRGIEDGINWRELGLKTITQKRQLTTNPFTNNHGVELEIDEIYVPMGLVERQKKEKPKVDVSPEEGSQLYSPEKEEYEVTRTYKNDEFFQQVLQQGESPKSQGKRLAIIGEPGAGKTTLLQKIADWVFATTKQDVAIWVSLADLQGRSLEDYLLQVWLKNTLEVVQVTAEMTAALGELFKSGRVWLLLDGVDEMVNANPLYSIASQITGWVANAKVVLSCRLNVWDAGKNALQGFDVYRNLDFDYPAQVKQFIHKWFNVTSLSPHLQKDGEQKPGGLAEQLLLELEQPGKERIRDLVKNPMRLMLLCFSWQKRQGSLPETKAGLYEQFVSALYEWKEEIFPTSSQQRRELNAALGRLALRGMEQSASRFRLRHRLVREVLGEVDEPLFKLALDLGWLNIVGVGVENPDENVYGFYHPTFQEYFAALAIDDWDYFLPRNHIDKPVEGKEYRIFEKEWNEVFLLWMGREDINKDKKEGFIQALVDFADGVNDFYGYKAYFKAAVAIGEFKNCSLADEIVNQIIQWGFGYFNIEAQEWLTFIYPIPKDAREILLLTDVEKVIFALIYLLDSTQDEYTRESVVQILGEIGVGNEQVIKFLISLLGSTQDEDTRKSVVQILGEIGVGNEQVIKFLISLLGSTQDEDTRINIAKSLLKIEPANKQAIKFLIFLLGYTQDFLKKVGCTLILRKISVGNEQLITSLISLVDSTQDEDTIIMVAHILGEIAVGNKQAITSLVSLLNSTQSEFTRQLQSVAESLGKIDPGNEQAITTLISLLNSTQNSMIAQGLADIGVGSRQAITALIYFLNSINDKSKFFGVTTFLEKTAVGNKQVITALVSLLNSTQCEDTISMITYILGKIAVGNKQAITALISLLNSTQDESIYLNIAKSLGKIDPGNKQAINTLIFLLNSTQDKSICLNVAESLGEIDPGNEQAITALISLLDYAQNEDTLSIVISSLQRIIKSEYNYLMTVSALRKHLNNEIYENNFKVYKYCFKTLWECAKNLTYPQFYQAWHTTPTYHPEIADYQLSSDTTTIKQLEQQYTDIHTLLQQVQPTNQTYPLPLNIQSLTGETNIGIISQEICNLIYLTAFTDADIPEGIDHPAKLTPKIQQIKKKFQKPNLALIFYYYEPYPELINFCNKLTNIVHIAWITDSKLEAPLKGFLPYQPNLLSAIQTWINEI